MTTPHPDTAYAVVRHPNGPACVAVVHSVAPGGVALVSYLHREHRWSTGTVLGSGELYGEPVLITGNEILAMTDRATASALCNEINADTVNREWIGTSDRNWSGQ